MDLFREDAKYVRDLMPCELNCSMLPHDYSYPIWIFWSSRPNAELDYQCKTIAPVVPSGTGIDKDTIRAVFEGIYHRDVCFVQFWAPVKVNGSTFLSTADQPFALTGQLDKRLCSYRKLCLNTLIPIHINNANGELLLGPPGRVFIRGFPEYSPDIQSYSVVEFPLLEDAIQLGIRKFCAIPVFKLPEKHFCRGVFEIASTDPNLSTTHILKVLHFTSSMLYSPCLPVDSVSKLSEPWKLALDQIKAGLDVVCKTHSLPFAQSWIPDFRPSSIKALIATGKRSDDGLNSMFDIGHASDFIYIQSGKAVVGRAFSSQESCFCKDVSLLSLTEYPLVPSARKARLTRCFAICLRSKCVNNFICVVEYFLPPNDMVDRDAETFLNMLLSTMKEQLPDVVVASGKELGEWMRVEVVKVSPSDELDSFEIGQPLPSVQSLEDGVENNVTTALLPSCSSLRLDSFNCERPLHVDTLIPCPTEEAVTNIGTVGEDVAHIEFGNRGEMMQPDSQFEKSNAEIDFTVKPRSSDKVEHTDVARCGRQLVEAECVNGESNFISGATKIQNINSQKKNIIQTIVEDYGITSELLEQCFVTTGLNSFESCQPLPSVQSLQDGGKIIEIGSLHQQPNLENGANNVATALSVPSCSSKKRDSFNIEGPVEGDLIPQHPTVTNRRRVDVDVAPDHIEIEKGRSEMMQPGIHFEQPNENIDSLVNTRSNDKVEHSDSARNGRQLVEPEVINRESSFVSGEATKTDSQKKKKKNAIQRIVKDLAITRTKQEEQFGETPKDAAKNLSVSPATLGETKKVNHHASRGLPCDSVMNVKLKYGGHNINFKLTPESTRVDLVAAMEKRFDISFQRFSFKYQDKDGEWILIATDSDLRDGMNELRSLDRTTMRLQVTSNPEP